MKAAALVSRHLSLKVIYVNHLPENVCNEIRAQADGIVEVCPRVQQTVIGSKSIHIPPFFDDERFLRFKTSRSRTAFFFEEFGVHVGNHPLICMIGNFYKNPLYKNHQLLLHAMHELVHQKKRAVQLVIAGGGDSEVKMRCQKLVHDLQLTNHVFFLGSVTNIPELLFQVDFHVLPSIQEAFGIVLLEAALMKKPSIIASGTGAAGNFIQHLKTGVIFENNMRESLVQNIEIMLDDSVLRKCIGEYAYTVAKEFYTRSAQIRKLVRFLSARNVGGFCIIQKID